MELREVLALDEILDHSPATTKAGLLLPTKADQNGSLPAL